MHLNVSCAIIEHKGLVLAVQRNTHMDYPLLWEFPGGKLEEGESASSCIIREIKEELGINIQVREALNTYTHANKGRTITLIPFVCHWKDGSFHLHEHAAARWLRPEELKALSWCPADIPLVKDYLETKK